MTYFNGITSFSLLLSFILCIPVSFFLVYIFKKIVEKKINSFSLFNEDEPEILVPNKNPFPGLKIILPEKNGKVIEGENNLKFFLPHFLSSIAASAACMCIVFTIDSFWEKGPVFFLFMTALHMTPILFCFTLFYRHNNAAIKKMWLLTAIIVLVFFIYFLSKNSIYNVLILFASIGFNAALITIICLVIYKFRNIRTLFPFVVTALFIIILILSFISAVLSGNSNLLAAYFYPVYDFSKAIGMENYSTTVFYFINILILLSGFALGFMLLNYSFIKKANNNTIMLIDFVWLSHILFTLSLPVANTSLFIYTVAVFVVYKLVQIISFKIFIPKVEMGINKTLLVLRVFSLKHESEKLFDMIRSYWLLNGPITLIAGHDLTASVVDIEDVLYLLTGRIKNRFNTTPLLIEKNKSKIDNIADIDGRYRVNEMYCTNTTWKSVLKNLIQSSNKVMMDIRTFTELNKGCAFEIKEIIYRVPLNNILFIANGKTDLKLAKGIMEEAWNVMPQTSPNTNESGQMIHVFMYETQDDLGQLINTLQK